MKISTAFAEVTMPQIQAQPIAEIPITFKEFFENVPPGKNAIITDLWLSARTSMGIINKRFNLPTLELHCTAVKCDGTRFFDAIYCEPLELKPESDDTHEYFVTYRCNNCTGIKKIYALRAVPINDNTGRAFKIGEFPSFGPPTPARVIKLLGAEKDYYLKGRQAENQGLGIAAFAYYRRVVENQKNKILDEIIHAAKLSDAKQDILDELEAAKTEQQFTKAIDAIKHGIPQILLIKGHNPLKLLHSALSVGLHGQTDEQCLELARTIRIVLSELAERLSYVLKDSAELNVAVSRLLKNHEKGNYPA